MSREIMIAALVVGSKDWFPKKALQKVLYIYSINMLV